MTDNTSIGPQITQDLLMKILNSVEEGIEAVDIKGNLFLYNPAMELLEGQKASDVLGKHMTEIYHLDWKTSLLLKVLNEKKPIFNQHQNYALQNGKCLDVLVSVVPLFNNNQIVGAAAIMRDFSKFREMAEKILTLQEKLNSNQTALQKKVSSQDHLTITFEKLIGKDIGFQQTIAWAKEAALTGSPILIYGETGTGKEFFAQSIHKFSKRSAGPFVAINCAAIPESL
ncbi:MAG: sigma 54-interacting transcriptional regulator, partial [Dehalobacterium sp.]